nr:DEP domain-containing mTOR-interacting protein [Aotus nancymaae]
MEEGSSAGSAGSDSSTSGSGGAQQRELERMAEVLVTGEQLRLRLHEEKVIKDRRHHLKTYPNCFVAKELIDWLIEHKEASDRETAIKLMQKLADRGIIHHVCDEHKEFKDVKLFYRFRKDDGTFPLDNEVKAFMRGQRLYEKLMSPENTLLQPREEEGVKYERTFMASEFLDWLVQEGEATTRKEAEQLCHRLMEHGIIQHVSNKHPFVDSNLLYQFRMNFRRRRRLMELLNEKSPSSQETHDSPFCLRKQSHDNRKSTSFMSVLKRPVTSEELLTPGAPYARKTFTLLGHRHRDDASAPGSGDETRQHRAAVACHLARDSVGLADLVPPVASMRRNNEELSQDDDGPVDGSGHLLGALNTHATVAIVVPNSNKRLEPGVLASTGQLLHPHNLQNFVLERGPQEEVNDLRFPDGQGEEIDLFQGPDLHVFDQIAQHGDGHPLLIFGLASVSSTASAPATSMAVTLVPDGTTEISEEATTPQFPHPRAPRSSAPHHTPTPASSAIWCFLRVEAASEGCSPTLNMVTFMLCRSPASEFLTHLQKTDGKLFHHLLSCFYYEAKIQQQQRRNLGMGPEQSSPGAHTPTRTAVTILASVASKSSEIQRYTGPYTEPNLQPLPSVYKDLPTVCQFVVSVNGLNVLHVDYRTVSNLILTGPRTIVMEVMEELEC